MTPDQEEELLQSLEEIRYSLDFLVRIAMQTSTKFGVIGVQPPERAPRERSKGKK